MYVKATEGLVQQLLADNGLKRTVFVSPLTASSKTLAETPRVLASCLGEIDKVLKFYFDLSSRKTTNENKLY